MLVGDVVLQAVGPSRRVGCCLQAGRLKHKLCWKQPSKRVVGIVVTTMFAIALGFLACQCGECVHIASGDTALPSANGQKRLTKSYEYTSKSHLRFTAIKLRVLTFALKPPKTKR